MNEPAATGSVARSIAVATGKQSRGGRRHAVRWRLAAFLGALLLQCVAQADKPLVVELFTDSPAATSLAPEGIHLTVYRIDGLQRLERQLSVELPNTLSQAKPEVLKRLAALDAESVAAAREAAQGLARALELGIDRYPAIVIDGSVVLYGTHDLVAARERYRQWREDHQS